MLYVLSQFVQKHSNLQQNMAKHMASLLLAQLAVSVVC